MNNNIALKIMSYEARFELKLSTAIGLIYTVANRKVWQRNSLTQLLFLSIVYLASHPLIV